MKCANPKCPQELKRKGKGRPPVYCSPMCRKLGNKGKGDPRNMRAWGRGAFA